MAGELARELGQFPFTKLRPADFRVEIAGLSEQELERHPVKIWVETDDIAKIVKIAGAARIIRTYPHLNFVYLETYASQLASLVRSELVHSVWNDEPVKADGCVVVAEPYPSARTLASWSRGRAC
jgi:hypothetical protein